MTLILLLFAPCSMAETDKNQIGTITRISGRVQLYSYPSRKVEGPKPRALFNGLYYTVRDAQIGDLVKKGNLLRTLPTGRAKVIFDNGDHYSIAPGTAYIAFWNLRAGRVELRVLHGKIRSVISNTGARRRLRLRTNSTILGIRGTDFYVNDEGKGGATEVSVLRGEVEVIPDKAQGEKTQLKTGYRAKVVAKKGSPRRTKGKPTSLPTKKKEAPIQVSRTTRSQLVEIYQFTTVKKLKEEDFKKNTSIPEPVKQQVQTLEKRSVETTLKDIQKEDPTLFAELKEKPKASSEDLNVQVIKNAFKVAPVGKAEEAEKLDLDLENLDEEAYEKFFSN